MKSVHPKHKKKSQINQSTNQQRAANHKYEGNIKNYYNTNINIEL